MLVVVRFDKQMIVDPNLQPMESFRRVSKFVTKVYTPPIKQPLMIWIATDLLAKCSSDEGKEDMQPIQHLGSWPAGGGSLLSLGSRVSGPA